MADLIFPPLPDGTLDLDYIHNYARLVLESQPGMQFVPVADLAAAAQAARDKALRDAATLIEMSQETTTIERGGDTIRHLSRRAAGNLAGLAWASALRELIGQGAQND